MTEMSVELLAALLNDEAKTKRLLALVEQEKKNQAILDAAHTARDEASDKLEEARKVLAQARAIEQANDPRTKALEKREKGLGEAIEGHNATVESFNGIRQQIEDDLATRTAALEANEADYMRRILELTVRENTVQRVHDETVELRDKYRRRHAEMAAVLADHA